MNESFHYGDKGRYVTFGESTSQFNIFTVQVLPPCHLPSPLAFHQSTLGVKAPVSA